MSKAVILWMEAALVCATMVLGGCATMDRKKAAAAGDLLVAAGFTAQKPSTLQDRANLENMEPLKMVRATRDGQTVYMYGDPYSCGCVYVGNEQQYAEYRRLEVERSIAETNLLAARTYQPGPPYWGWWR